MTLSHKITLTLMVCMGWVFPRSAMAHDGWVEISPTIVEKNQAATIALLQGNHSNEHKSYRIAGKWDSKYTTLVIVDPTGKQNTLTDRLIDLGEDAETIGPKGPKGFHLASFVPKVDGLYQVLARQVRTVQQGEGPKLLTIRLAKTAFAAFKVPTVSASVQEQTTDEKGRVNFAVGPADSYLARVKFDEETPRSDGQKDKASYESTYVFQVFNRP